jgi:GDP-L-fucose synthase
LTIADLARLICDELGYQGELQFDASKPDGTPRKLMSSKRLAAMGWTRKIALRDGIRSTYQWFLSNAL